ncbi:hypothetical protein TNCV_4456161 [Trichonephila clavipes]|nr:hypothetical protein TNCV_4456161 [Trichonephila clavipes]
MDLDFSFIPSIIVSECAVFHSRTIALSIYIDWWWRYYALENRTFSRISLGPLCLEEGGRGSRRLYEHNYGSLAPLYGVCFPYWKGIFKQDSVSCQKLQESKIIISKKLTMGSAPGRRHAFVPWLTPSEVTLSLIMRRVQMKVIRGVACEQFSM